MINQPEVIKGDTNKALEKTICDEESHKSSWRARRTVSCNEAASTGEALIAQTSRWILDQTCNPESLRGRALSFLAEINFTFQ